MPEWMQQAMMSGVLGGLIAWGGLRVELKWLRRDVDDHHSRLTYIERSLGGRRKLRLAHGDDDEGE